jgi:hypothetical protein
MVNYTRIMYQGTKFCVKYGENKVTSFAPQTGGGGGGGGVTMGHILNPKF